MTAKSDDIFQILVLIGAINDEDDVKYVLASIKAGILRWSQKLNVLPEIDECLLDFEASNKYIADEESLAPYFKFTHTRSNITITVLVSPTCYIVNQEIAGILRPQCDWRLVVYGGHSINSQANWCFKDGVFSVEDMLYVFTDPNIVATLKRADVRPKLTISCCKASGFKLAEDSESSVEIEAIDPFHSKSPDCEGERSPVTKGINKFIGKLEDVMADQTQGIFTQLEPPIHEGFLKLRNPCIYIFPSGNGDSAFFTVNGFNVLLNGGALARPWFWRLIRHQDRVDCIIATHLGNDCLTGINSFLLRKLQERQIRLPMDGISPEYKKLARCLLSPDLGVFFMNAPRKFCDLALKKGSESVYDDVDNEDHTIFQQLNVRPTDTVQQTLRLSKSLGLEVKPLTRSSTPEPFTLFSKYGIGRLDLYVISPGEDSKELAYIHDKWGCDGKSINQTAKTGIKLGSGKEGESLVSDLASIACLLVWHPFSQNDKIVRVLFPGNAPQDKLFEGLEKLKHLDFLSTRCPTEAKLAKGKVSAKTTKPTTTKTKTFAPKSAPTASGKVTHHSSQSATTTTKSSYTSLTSRVTASKSATSTASKTSQQVTSRAPVPLLSKVQTAASRPEKKTTIGATRKPIGAARKQAPPAKIESTSSKTKREGNNLVKSAEKRTKSEKLPSANAAASKPKPGPVHAKAEARVKTKQVAGKATARASAAAKDTGKVSAKSTVTKAPTNIKATKKQNVTSTSKTGISSPGKAKSGLIGLQEKKPISKAPSTRMRSSPKASSAFSKAKTPVSPPEDLTVAISNLPAKETSVADQDKTAELWKRPSPEGQDEGQFVENINKSVEDNVALEKGDAASIEKADKDNKHPDVVSESEKAPISENVSQSDETFEVASDNSSPKPDTTEQDENTTSLGLGQIDQRPDDSEDAGDSSDVKPCYDQTGDLNKELPSQSFIGNESSDVQISQSSIGEGSVADHLATNTEEDRQYAAKEDGDDFTGQELIKVIDTAPKEGADVTKIENIEEHNEDIDDNAAEEELKENVDPEIHGVTSDHHLHDDANQDDNTSSGHNVHLGDAVSVVAATTVYHEYSNKENVDPIHGLSDPLTDPAASPSSNLATPEAAEDFALEENQEYLEVEDRGLSAESDIGDVAINVESSTPSEQVGKEDASHLQTQDDSQLDYLDNTHRFDKEYAEKEEIPLSDPPCSYSTTSTMSKRALLESPCSTELDSTYNIPSTVGSVAASAIEPENEQGAAQPVSDFYDDNGNRANDAWKLGSSDINTEYPASPIVAWSGGEEPNDHLLDKATSFEDPIKHKEDVLLQEELVSSSTDVNVGTLHAHDDEPVAFSLSDDGKPSSLIQEERDVGMIQGTLSSVVPESPEIQQSGPEESPLSPVLLPEALSSPTLERQLSDSHASSQSGTLSSSSEEDEPDQSSPETQRLEDPVGIVLRNDHNVIGESFIGQHSNDDIDPSQNHVGRTSSESYYERYQSNSPEYYDHSDYQGYDVSESERNGEPESSSSEESSSSKESSSIRQHDEGSIDAPSSIELNNDLRQLHAGQSSVSELSSCEYDVTNDQKAALIRMSDEMYSDHIENNPSHNSGTYSKQGTVEVEDSMHYMDVANRSNKEDFGIFDHNTLKSEGTLSTEEQAETRSPNEMAPSCGASITAQACHTDPDQSASPFDPFQNQFVDKMADGDEWFKQDSNFSSLEQGIGHEGTFTFGANNPFVADIVGQNLPQQRNEDDLAPIRTPDPMMPQDRPTSSKTKKSATAASGNKKSDPPAFYFDLTYVPHHANKNHCGAEFFKRIRSKFYVISGFDASNHEPSVEALRGLLEGKMTWGDSSGSNEDSDDVTVIPTHNSAALHTWYEDLHRELDAENVHLVASGSKVLMHNESIDACKIEF